MYRKVLLTSLYENCQSFEWFTEVTGYVRESQWAKLYDWTECANTVVYSTPQEHYAVTQVGALVRKAPFHWRTLELQESPESNAMHTFAASEIRCGEANARLRDPANYGTYSFKIDYMRRWIAHVLGSKPNLLAIYDKADFSSGSAIGVHGNATNLYRKLFASDWSVTALALPYARSFFKRNTNLSEHLLKAQNGFVCYDNDEIDMKVAQRAKVVRYNKLSFVPKTVKTHRVIAVEPLLNSVLQKGVDTVMREKLLRNGYDLRDQGKNQYLAKIGSIDGSLATMDLSAASDSISIELARMLLPWDWFDLLNRLRSPSYELAGQLNRYEKFCSMGNGFCFPLETLIFAAALRASVHAVGCSDRRNAVYGDDIIVPVEAYDELEALLSFLGFTVNETKSFKEGPFRESCGADWYLGQDVRPVFLDYALSCDTMIRIFHNATLRGTRSTWWFYTIRPYLRKQVPKRSCFLRPHDARSRKMLVPKGLSQDEKFIMMANMNGAFDVDLDIFMGSNCARWNTGTQSWQWEEYLYSPMADSSADPNFVRAQYLAFLRGSPEGLLALRRKTRVSVINKQ